MKVKSLTRADLKKYLVLMAAVTLAVPGSNPAQADAFDTKVQAQAAQESQAAEQEAFARRYQAILNGNASILRRIPSGTTITGCFNRSAELFRRDRNGCDLKNTEWNGIPVQICTEDYDRRLPPEIVVCHYHVPGTGQDCEIVLNAGVAPRCL